MLGEADGKSLTTIPVLMQHPILATRRVQSGNQVTRWTWCAHGSTTTAMLPRVIDMIK
jgi:hypothetical protein